MSIFTKERPTDKLSGVELPKVDLSKVEMPKVDLSKVVDNQYVEYALQQLGKYQP